MRSILITLLIAGCNTDKDTPEDTGPEGVSLLGGYTHSLDGLSLTEIASCDCLRRFWNPGHCPGRR